MKTDLDQIESNYHDTAENRLIQSLRDAYEPLGIEALMQRAAGDLSRATLLRRLEKLIAEGRVERLGKARATRYRLAAPPHAPATPAPVRVRYQDIAWEPAPKLREPGVDDVPGDAVPTENPVETAERERVLAALRRPLSARPRMDYQREFLEEYAPNRTFYLPEALREELRLAGQSDEMARLPAGTYVQQVFQRVLIDLSWNSSRLEGNTYSLLETERLLELGRGIDPARSLEARMILNHKEAIAFLVEMHDEIGWNRHTVLNLHALLTHDLLNDRAGEGRLRNVPVGIGGSAYRPPDIPQLIEECFMTFLAKAGAIDDPLEQAFFAMVHLPYLQPFVDGNKRTSRLAANIPLIRENLAPLSFVDVPVRDYTEATLAVYELNRLEPLRHLFAQAYRASAGRYAAVRGGMRMPDHLGLVYHEAIREVAREVVQRRLDKATAAEHIRLWSLDKIPPADRARVVELVESNLLALHEGNFAKYRLRPSEFAAWHEVWARKP